MNKQNNSARLLLLVVVLAMALLAAGCDQADAIPETTPVEPLVLQERSLMLGVGDSAALTVSGGDQIAWTSSDTQVVSVDEAGNLKALTKGHALITVTSGDQVQYCGILVEPTGEMLDVSNTKPSVVFSDVQLYHPMEIVNFGADTANNAFYFSQPYATAAYRNLPADSILTKVTQVDGVWQRSEYMHLTNHGYGYFGLEVEGQDVYLLTESNGTMSTGGTTISRVKWEHEGMCDEQFGETYALPGLTGTFRPQSDVENDLLAVYAFNGRNSYYAIYDRDAFFSGEQSQYLHLVECARDQTPARGTDASNGGYNSSIRGFAIHDGYIYQVSGSATIYLSVFDLEGKLQYCHEIKAVEGASNPRAGSISFGADGHVYLAVTTSENTNLYYANVWMLEEVE